VIQQRLGCWRNPPAMSSSGRASICFLELGVALVGDLAKPVIKGHMPPYFVTLKIGSMHPMRRGTRELVWRGAIEEIRDTAVILVKLALIDGLIAGNGMRRGRGDAGSLSAGRKAALIAGWPPRSTRRIPSALKMVEEIVVVDRGHV